MHLSSFVLGGDPSRAVFRASTGLFLRINRKNRNPIQIISEKLVLWYAKGGDCKEINRKRKGFYCLSKLSILRDLCSILMIIASALSASTCSAAIQKPQSSHLAFVSLTIPPLKCSIICSQEREKPVRQFGFAFIQHF